jgi:type IV pilus assembly protein PilV
MTRRPLRRRRLRARDGFSLISVLVAMVLLMTGVAALARTQAAAIAAQRSETGRNLALSLAQAHMERLRAQDPNGIGSEALVQIDSLGAVNANGRFQRRVIVTDDAANLIRVRVQITPPRGAVPVELMTIFYKPTVSP